MKSKPIYGTLELDTSARRHLFVVQGLGLDAAQRALERSGPCDALLLDTPDPADLLNALTEQLQTVGMETAFYIAGPETFLWQITQALRAAGVEQRRIQQELTGSKARDVYCVHCRTRSKGVTMSVHRCEGCGLTLTVRDHFSRPLGAYMGVIVDAETPGVVPEPEMLYA